MEISHPQEETISDDENYSPPRANAFALINMSGAFSLSKMVAKSYLESVMNATTQSLSSSAGVITSSSDENNNPLTQRFSPRPEMTSLSTSTCPTSNRISHCFFLLSLPPLPSLLSLSSFGCYSLWLVICSM
jgi:hypothetical protein